MDVTGRRHDHFLQELIFARSDERFKNPVLILEVAGRIPIVEVLRLFFEDCFKKLIVQSNVIFFQILQVVHDQASNQFQAFQQTLV